MMTEIEWNKSGGEVWDKDNEIYMSETKDSVVFSFDDRELDSLISALQTIRQERDRHNDNWLEKNQ